MSEMWNLQRWLEERRVRLVPKTLGHQRFRAAYDFLLLRIKAGEVNPEIGVWWTRLQEADEGQKKRMISELSMLRKKSPRRRRHRRRKT